MFSGSPPKAGRRLRRSKIRAPRDFVHGANISCVNGVTRFIFTMTRV